MSYSEPYNILVTSNDWMRISRFGTCLQYPNYDIESVNKYDLELRDLRISSELKADAHLSRRGQIAPMELGLG